jgi:hypothetical protein
VWSPTRGARFPVGLSGRGRRPGSRPGPKARLPAGQAAARGCERSEIDRVSGVVRSRAFCHLLSVMVVPRRRIARNFGASRSKSGLTGSFLSVRRRSSAERRRPMSAMRRYAHLPDEAGELQQEPEPGHAAHAHYFGTFTGGWVRCVSHPLCRHGLPTRCSHEAPRSISSKCGRQVGARAGTLCGGGFA